MDINQLLKFNIFVLETQEKQRDTSGRTDDGNLSSKETDNSIITWTKWLTFVMEQAWSQIPLQAFHRFLGGNSKCYRKK